MRNKETYSDIYNSVCNKTANVCTYTVDFWDYVMHVACVLVYVILIVLTLQILLYCTYYVSLQLLQLHLYLCSRHFRYVPLLPNWC